MPLKPQSFQKLNKNRIKSKYKRIFHLIKGVFPIEIIKHNEILLHLEGNAEFRVHEPCKLN